MKAFAALVASLTRATLENDSAMLLSATTHEGPQPLPPLYAAHLFLDGHEYMLTLVPTDLGDRGAALQEGEDFEPHEWKDGDEEGAL